jgi:hypothetical protein
MHSVRIKIVISKLNDTVGHERRIMKSCAAVTEGKVLSIS